MIIPSILFHPQPEQMQKI